jgi:C-terminal processing protease CtpA/Prc
MLSASGRTRSRAMKQKKTKTKVNKKFKNKMTMKKYILTVLISILAIGARCQTQSISKFNWDFEDVLNGKPQVWLAADQPGYSVFSDSVNVQSGKYSVVIESTGESGNFQPITIRLPDNYDGQRITFSGYIKTENVADGYAGLWMRIDPQIAFDNMSQRGVTGTTDWAKHEITLPMNPSKTEGIFLGGMLVGKGKIWLDNFTITIDGKDIAEAKIFERELLPAEKDKEFDTGSGIVFSALNEQIINNLELLGKLWGFLKYHHPEVGKGNHNWDYELFRILPSYLKTEDTPERDKVLIGWINKYGAIPVCATCKETPADAYLKPTISWMEKSDMSSDLKKKIQEIYSNRHQGEHFYIKMSQGVGNPEFLNENQYSNMPYPDAGFRLLALYRYWSAIQYFFPSTYLTDKNWEEVLKEYIPLFILAKDELDYELSVFQIIAEINDTHAAGMAKANGKIREYRGENAAPYQVQFVDQKLVVTDFKPELRETSGLEIGDVITHINGKTVEFIVDSVKKYYPASNEPSRLRNISMDLLRSSGSNMTVQYISAGQTKQKDISLFSRESLQKHRNYREITVEKCYKIIDGNIGYFTLSNMKDEDVAAIKEQFKNTNGIIIDARNYPSVFTPFTLGTFFVSAPTPFVKFTQGNVNNPGEFTFRDGQLIPYSGETYQGKVVVIVNEYSQSSSEYHAMAFRAGDNTTVIGSQTAGADGNVSRVSLPGGIQTMISGIGVYYPDGTQTQRIGIVPDVKVAPTINGIMQGRDEVLEKAIEIIEKQ